ncbi:MAG: hypothetical protein AAF682_08535 [Planctomycetota bacterium]
MKRNLSLRLAAGFSSFVAVLSLSLPLGFAQASGAGGGSQGGGDSGGDDDIGSLPSLANEQAPDWFLVGTMADLQSIVLDVKGSGSISLRPATPNNERLIASFQGNLQVTLDAAALATSPVHAAFSSGTTFAGGTASVFAGGAWTEQMTLGTMSIRELPLASLGATDSMLFLHATSLESEFYSLHMAGDDGVVTMTQKLRE